MTPGYGLILGHGCRSARRWDRVQCESSIRTKVAAPLIYKAFHVLLHMIEAPFGLCLMVIDDCRSAIHDTATGLASAQAQIDILRAIHKLRIETTDLCKQVATNHQTGARHHVQVTLAGDSRVVGGGPSQDMIRDALNKLHPRMLYRAIRIQQPRSHNANRGIAVGDGDHRRQPVRVGHSIIVQEKNVFAPRICGALIAGASKTEIAIVAQHAQVALHRVQQIYGPVG